MTPVARLFRNAIEKLLGRFYEGPSAPERLSEQVVAFAVMNPGATREEWAIFATRLAVGSYRDGFTRGFEWAERDLDRLDLGAPERIAELDAHDFDWHAPGHLTANELREKVGGDFLDSLPDDAARARYLDSLGRYQGAFRVVALPPDRRVPPRSR
jgi:hypothetical protein